MNDKDDKLFKFKKSMSSQEHKFFIGERINKKDIYLKLKNSWKKNTQFYMINIRIGYYVIT